MSFSSGTTNNPGGGSLYIDIKSLQKNKHEMKGKISRATPSVYFMVILYSQITIQLATEYNLHLFCAVSNKEQCGSQYEAKMEFQN
jgi:hypothetical protein